MGDVEGFCVLVDVDGLARAPFRYCPVKIVLLCPISFFEAFEDSTEARCVLRWTSMVVLPMSDTKGEILTFAVSVRDASGLYRCGRP